MVFRQAECSLPGKPLAFHTLDISTQMEPNLSQSLWPGWVIRPPKCQAGYTADSSASELPPFLSQAHYWAWTARLSYKQWAMHSVWSPRWGENSRMMLTAEVYIRIQLRKNSNLGLRSWLVFIFKDMNKVIVHTTIQDIIQRSVTWIHRRNYTLISLIGRSLQQ